MMDCTFYQKRFCILAQGHEGRHEIESEAELEQCRADLAKSEDEQKRLRDVLQAWLDEDCVGECDDPMHKRARRALGLKST